MPRAPILTKAGAEFVTPLSVSAALRGQGLPGAVLPHRRSRDGPYRAVALGRPGGGGAGHRRPDGQGRQRPRQRPGLHHPAGHRQAGADGPGDERADVGARRHAAQRRAAPGRRRRRDRRSRRRPDGLRRVRPGPPGRARAIVAADPHGARSQGPQAAARLPASAPSSPPARRREPLDPVRVITNRSSGKQGYAIADALARLGADVPLVSGPTAACRPRRRQRREGRDRGRHAGRRARPPCPPTSASAWPPSPTGARRHAPDQARSSRAQRRPPSPCSWSRTPTSWQVHRLKKKGRPRLVVGFAAETNDVEKHARAKLTRKGCDWIVANDVSGDVMGGADNDVLLVTEGRHGTLAAHVQGRSRHETGRAHRRELPRSGNQRGGIARPAGYGLGSRPLLGQSHDPPHRLFHPERPARGHRHHRSPEAPGDHSRARPCSR